MELSLLKILEDNANLTPEQLAVMCRKEVGDIKKAIYEYEKEGVIVGYKTMMTGTRPTGNMFRLSSRSRSRPSATAALTAWPK